MKKIIGIPLLLLANIIIVAHAIVPHHHHNGIIICIHDFWAENKDLGHNHDHSQPHTHHHNHDLDNHHHDCDCDESCLFNNLFLQTNKDKQRVLSVDIDTFKDWGYTLISAIVPNHQIEIQDYGNLSFRQKPYIVSFYNHYVTHSLGLRAPPSC